VVISQPQQETLPVQALPERTRLLHIGLMKTGTTALQRAASRRRKALLRHGVRYPGRQYNHRQAALALMNASTLGPRTAPEPDAWLELLKEVHDDQTRRVLISNEFICGSDERTAQRFLDDLGSPVHVVVTVRNVAATLPSLWQQYVKTGWTQDFPEFLTTVLDPQSTAAELPAYYARNDQGVVVSRWAALAGSQNVTVVVADKARPRRIQEAFETMLGLPAGLLDLPKIRGYTANRSLSAEEVSLFLAVNRRLPPGKVSQDDLVRILQGGSVARVLDQRGPPPSDQRVVVPAWARGAAAELGTRYADAITRAGVRVIGDLAELSRVFEGEGIGKACETIPVELAAEAVIGAISAGLHRGSDFGTPRPQPDRPQPPGPARQVLRRVARHRVVQQLRARAGTR